MTSTELEVIEDAELEHAPTLQVGLFGSGDPAEFLEKASGIATVLADMVKKQGLVATIAGKQHPLVEAWTCLGSMLGVFPICVWTREIDGGWEARVEARTLSGGLVGAAEAMCLTSENRWKKADAYAVRSMAQTRATSKALRQPLGFVMHLAGFATTPAEEMPQHVEQRQEGPLPIPVPRTWAEVKRLIDPYPGLWEDFTVFGAQAAEHLFPGLPTDALDQYQKTLLLQKSAGAAVHLCDAHPGPDFLPPPTIDMVRQAFASVLEGVMLLGPSEDFQAAVEAAMKEDVEFKVPAKAKK